MSVGIDYIIFFVGLAGLIVGTFTDFKRREVPDWVSYGMIFSGLGLRLLYSLVTYEWSYFLYGLLGFGIFLGIGYLMFYTGQWGGGDSKVLMGIGALFATKPIAAIYTDKILPIMPYPVPFLGNLFFNILVVGAIYGVVWSVAVMIVHWKVFKKQAKITFADTKIRWMRLAVLITSTLLLIVGFVINDFVTRVLILLLLLLVFLGFYLVMFVKILEKGCMIKSVKISELTEGDWIVNDVIIGKKKITGPKDLGISLKQIAELKEYEKQGKIKEVVIKTGIPFVPSFLLAFVLTLIVGNVMYLIF